MPRHTLRASLIATAAVLVFAIPAAAARRSVVNEYEQDIQFHSDNFTNLPCGLGVGTMDYDLHLHGVEYSDGSSRIDETGFASFSKSGSSLVYTSGPDVDDFAVHIHLAAPRLQPSIEIDACGVRSDGVKSHLESKGAFTNFGDKDPNIVWTRNHCKHVGA